MVAAAGIVPGQFTAYGSGYHHLLNAAKLTLQIGESVAARTPVRWRQRHGRDDWQAVIARQQPDVLAADPMVDVCRTSLLQQRDGVAQDRFAVRSHDTTFGGVVRLKNMGMPL
jgi:hypothetical protein